MQKLIILLTFVSIAYGSHVSEIQPIANLKLGKLSGIRHHGSIGNLSVFLGIQYGEAPTGKYRFKPPIPTTVWNGIKNANDYGPICIQTKHLVTKSLNESQMDENCLYLNVYVPREIFGNPSFQQLPVLVFIHTGHFLEGAGSLLDGVYTAEQTDSIVVTFNYRLGIFGFLSLANHLPGNIGLLDQILALRWIKDNIASFGGDPENLTILTGSVQANIIQSSHPYENLFNRIISYNEMLSCSFSRSGLSDGILQSDIVSSRCLHSDILTCLQNLSPDEIRNISIVTATPWRTSLFQPVIDDVVIKHRPVELIKTGEFIHTDQLILHQNVKPYLPWVYPNMCSARTLDTAIEYISNFVDRGLKPVQKLVLHTMFSPVVGTSEQYCAKVISLMNEFQKSNIVRILKERSKYALTFLALFSDDNSQSQVPNATDSDVLCTMFKQTDDECQGTRGLDDVTVIKMIRTFLHFGYPSAGENLIWRPYSVQNHNHIVVMGNITETGDTKNWPFLKVEMLWNHLIPSLAENNTTSKISDKDHSEYSIDWGMTEQQLEALLFSLILTCLVLLLTSLTLLRIVCYVKGKPFQKPHTKHGDKPAAVFSVGEIKHNGINQHIHKQDNKEIPSSGVAEENDKMHDGGFKESSVL